MSQYDYLVVGAGLSGAVFCQCRQARRQVGPSHRSPRPHRRQHLHRGRRGHPGPPLRRAYLPHLHEGRLGLRQPLRRVQQLRQLAGSQLPRQHVQHALQHEHLRQDVARRRHAGGRPRQDRRAGGRREHRRAAEPRGAGHQPGRHRHLRKAHQGLHRQAVGPPLHRAARVHHQAPARPFYLRRQLLQCVVSG